jgi:hypothetical protein
MLSTHRSGTEYLISLRFTTTIATKLLLVSTLAVIAACFLSTPARSQYGSLPIGQVTSPTAEACPTSQWYPGTTCFSATLSN